ncbi:MAG TPA: serine/threonine-protein kinase, partial [Herpetosiphonaceae bacterium]
MTTSPAQPTPPLLHNRYRITNRLGENRLAVVYQAQDERLGRRVLVHVLRPQLQENEQLKRRFGEEAQAQARRNHPALLELFDSGEVGGRPYMITEDVEGRPLAEALPLPLPRAVQVWRQIVGGVATTISTNTPTPPITSKTILLTDAGRPVLTESWWLDADALRLELAHYRAPERTLGSPPDERNLVYSLGILGYELLGGIRPFSGTDAAQVQNLHVQRSLPPAMELAPGFTPSLAAALAMATARDPQARTATVQALARDLAGVESVAEAPTRQMLQPVKLRESVREAIKPITQRRAPPPPSPTMAPS